MAMPLGRSAMILLVCLAVLMSTAGSALAVSKLMPTPPVPLGQGQASTPTRPGPTATPLPRTGIDLPSQLMVASALLVGGLALRTRRTARAG